MHHAEHGRRLVTRKRSIIALAAIVILVVLAVLIWPRHQGIAQKDAVFVIDGKGYSRQDVAGLTSYATNRGANPDDVARQAFDLLKRQRAAEKLGLKVSSKTVDAIARDQYDAAKHDNAKWLRLLAYDDALNEMLGRLGQNGRVEGEVFFFNFSRYLLHGPAYTPPHLGDAKRIAADRRYAKQQAQHYRAALAGGKLTPEQAIKQIKADARLADMGLKGANLSWRFAGGRLLPSSGDNGRNLPHELAPYVGGRLLPTSGDNGRNLPPEVADYVQQSSAKTGLSEIRTGRSLVDAAVTNPTNKDYADSYFYVVKIAAVDHRQSQAHFDQTVKQLSARYIGLNRGNSS